MVEVDRQFWLVAPGPWLEIDLSAGQKTGRRCSVSTPPDDKALGTRTEASRPGVLGRLKSAPVYPLRAVMAWVNGLLKKNPLKQQQKALDAGLKDLLSARALKAMGVRAWRAQFLEVFQGKNKLARLIDGLHAVKAHARDPILRGEAERLLTRVFASVIQAVLRQRHCAGPAERASLESAGSGGWRDLAESVQGGLTEVLSLRDRVLLSRMPFDPRLTFAGPAISGERRSSRRLPETNNRSANRSAGSKVSSGGRY